jgi:protein involved in polysaccharide export with SLBB domain
MSDSRESVEFMARRPALAGYVLAVGDRFNVNFLFEPQLNTDVRVRPDGRIAVPILGDVPVAGTTPSQLDSLLTAAYTTYFRNPEITINVTEFAPPSVYVMGEVAASRAVELRPGMTAIQALAMAGGPTRDANLGSVILLRRASDTRAVAQRIDVSGFLGGSGDSWDVLLAPHDILYVPATFVAQLDRWVDHFFGGLMPIPTLYLRGWEAFNTEDVYDTFYNTSPGR